MKTGGFRAWKKSWRTFSAASERSWAARAGSNRCAARVGESTARGAGKSLLVRPRRPPLGKRSPAPLASTTTEQPRPPPVRPAQRASIRWRGCPSPRETASLASTGMDAEAQPASSELKPQRSESNSLRFAGATFQGPRAWNQATQGGSERPASGATGGPGRQRRRANDDAHGPGLRGTRSGRVGGAGRTASNFPRRPLARPPPRVGRGRGGGSRGGAAKRARTAQKPPSMGVPQWWQRGSAGGTGVSRWPSRISA